MKRLFTLTIVVVLMVLFVGFYNFVQFLRTPSDAPEQTLVIERGMSVPKVIESLKTQDIISNPLFFKIYIHLYRAGPKIRAGEYRFPAGVLPTQVLEMLLQGDFATHRLTIPEGWTMQEIANFLGSQGLAQPDRFLEKCRDLSFILSLGLWGPTLEGYLFPDTYEIYKPKNEEEILKKLVSRFQEIYQKEFEQRTRELGMTVQDVVTLASLVEKETGKKEERPIIASVFYNRLKRGMPLATDPSVIYGTPNFSGNLTRQHLMTAGPYNTYLNLGLPPTPIANPGADAIRAVLYPVESDYLYFVSKNDGTHYFSRNEEEHQQAVRIFQIQQAAP